MKNNIERFDDDFRFQLTREEVGICSRSKNLTLNIKGGRGHNIKYLPYAFTEQGIYMLMTVLKGDLADILYYGTERERIFLCGTSSKDGGRRISSILEDRDREKYHSMIDGIIRNPILELK